MCTCAFRNTSYDKLLSELGWNSLDERRKLARLNIFYKMNHTHRVCEPNNLCTDCKNGIGIPPYLANLCPATVGDRAGYVLRNAGDLRTIQSKKAKLYNSFVPKCIREWNLLPTKIHNAVSNNSFKFLYKKQFFRQVNPFYAYEKENANIHHTRLRLGLSHLRSHLFTYNLIDDPMCQHCLIENETTEHFLLRCPSFTVPRMLYLQGLNNILDHNYIANLSDNDIVHLFLHGDLALSNTTNFDLFSMAQSYIIDTSRF